MNNHRTITTNWEGAIKPQRLVKLYARGKIGLLFSGDAQYGKTAEECFRQALDICVGINANSFAKKMHNHGASEQVIHEFLENCILVDEVYFNPNAA